MSDMYNENDYTWIREILLYPQNLEKHLNYLKDTSQIKIPDDPIEKVIFQDKAKKAIRKIAQNRGHMLMVGRPGTGKSLLAGMFRHVLDMSLGDYIRPKKSIAAFQGKDINHVRFAYEEPVKIGSYLVKIRAEIEQVKNSIDPFSLADQIASVRKARKFLLWGACLSIMGGIFFSPLFIITGLAGIGAIFMFMQENNHTVQEKVQQETHQGKAMSVKHIVDMLPEILYDPRQDKDLMVSISEPSSKNMKGGFRHDPYQSGNMQTPIHKRAYLGAHAKAPIIYIDELKTLVRTRYMSSLLEIMQNKEYMLEGGKNTGSGAADRSENCLKADNIIIETSVPETADNIKQVAQYIKQELINLEQEFENTWGKVMEKEGPAGVRRRSEQIYGKRLPVDYELKVREFSSNAVAEIIKELRCRSSDGKLSCILRPVNGVIKTAELDAIIDNAEFVEPKHIRTALEEHLSLEGAVSKEIIEHKKDLKKYITSMTDSIGYVVGLAVINSRASGQMFGQPLPIHCQINTGGSDIITAPGKIGDIAKAAAQNVRASIKRLMRKIESPYVGCEMHIEYVQAHGGVEGDSASVAMDVGLISDYIQEPVNQKYGITGSLTGDIILAVGGVTEKIRSIMDTDLTMEGACIPWQNKYDIEPLLVNMETEYIQLDEVPGIRIYRSEGKKDPFDTYFCKTKYNAYRIMMGLNRDEVEERMAERSRKDLEFTRQVRSKYE